MSMVNLSGTSSVRYEGDRTLSQIQDAFKDVGKDQHIRFNLSKNLHTHGRTHGSMMDFMAFFNNPTALAMRDGLRQRGAMEVMKAIDKEFGDGMGFRVFMEFDVEFTENLMPKGVTREQLDGMGEMAEQLRQKDLKAAQERLGVDDMDAHLDKARMEYALELDLKPEEALEVRTKVVNALNALPQTATKEECERVALGVLIEHDLVSQMKQELGTELKPEDTDGIRDLMDHCFKPGEPYTRFDPSDIHTFVMSEFTAKGKLPTIDQLGMTLVRNEALNKTTEEKGDMIHDFCKELSGGGPDGPGIDKDKVDSFLLGNPNKPDDLALPVYTVLRDIGSQSMSGVVSSTLKDLKEMPSFGVQEWGLRGTQEEKVTTAKSSLEFLDKTMEKLLGGTTDEDIQKAVDELPQEFCDLLAKGHNGIDTGMKYVMSPQEKEDLEDDEIDDRQKELESQAKEKMHRELDSNFLARRMLNPLLTEGAQGDPGLTRKVGGLTKLIQDVANGGPDVNESRKDKPLPEVAPELQEMMDKWGPAYQRFMELARERGVPG